MTNVTVTLEPPRPLGLPRVDRLTSTALALMATTAITSGLGVAFWGVASRRFSARTVGEGAALISAMMFLSLVAQLNLSMGIARLLPRVQQGRWRPVAAAYGTTAALGAIVATAFVVVAPRLSDGFAFIDPQIAMVLVGSVVLWNVFALQDAVLTASRWATAVPIENTIFGMLKIALLFVFARQGIFVAWVAAMAIMIVPINGLIFGKVLRRDVPAAETSAALPFGDRRRVARYLAGDYVAALLSQGYQALLPLLVVAFLGSRTNGYFYIAFLICGTVGALGQALSTSVVVEGAHDESALGDLTRRSIKRYLTLVLPVVVALVVIAPYVLRLFGPGYADQTTSILRLLLVGTIPQAVVMLYLGVERVRARVKRILAAEALSVVLVTGGIVFGMRLAGLVGLGWAWIAAQTVVALIVAGELRRSIGASR